jgi:hypothetical protein
MYGQYSYNTPSYLGNTYQNPYQRQNVPQQMQFPTQPQPQIQQQPIPQIQDVRYGTEEEAKAFIVYPNASAYFIDEPKGRLYIKTANNAGASSMSYFALTPINADGSPIKPQEETPKVDMSEYIKRTDLAQFNFITMPQLEEILSKFKSVQPPKPQSKPISTTNSSI